MKGARIVFALIIPLLLFGQPRQSAQRKPLVFINATVIDATGAPPMPDTIVVIAGGRIIAFGHKNEITVPEDAHVIDAVGKYLIPGLWDMHVHSLAKERVRLLFPLFIAYGITGVRDMGAPLDELENIGRGRNEVEQGILLGPHIVAAGPILDGPQLMFPEYSISNEAEARKAVGSIAASGADFVKVYSLLTREAYFAIADQSKSLGLQFAGHVAEAISALEASDAGQGSIEHLSGIWKRYRLLLSAPQNISECSTRSAQSRPGRLLTFCYWKLIRSKTSTTRGESRQLCFEGSYSPNPNCKV
jgi:hypothetical protein